jgi:hypothetical protein
MLSVRIFGSAQGQRCLSSLLPAYISSQTVPKQTRAHVQCANCSVIAHGWCGSVTVHGRRAQDSTPQSDIQPLPHASVSPRLRGASVRLTDLWHLEPGHNPEPVLVGMLLQGQGCVSTSVASLSVKV